MNVEKLIADAVRFAIEGTAFSVAKGAKRRESETWGLPNGIVVMAIPPEVEVVRRITVEKGVDGREIEEKNGVFVTPYGGTRKFFLRRVGGSMTEWVTVENFEQDPEHHHKGGARVTVGDRGINLKGRFHRAESPGLHAKLVYLAPEDLESPRAEAA